jgi:hypothetical protein
LFSTFPGGSPGFGLLILRIALSVTTLVRSAAYLSESGGAAFLHWLPGFFMIAPAVFVLIGFLTPPSAAIVFTGGMLAAVLGQTSTAVEIYGTVLAAAIALLGPGAFSVDARLFGRREIIIPKNSVARE